MTSKLSPSLPFDFCSLLGTRDETLIRAYLFVQVKLFCLNIKIELFAQRVTLLRTDPQRYRCSGETSILTINETWISLIMLQALQIRDVFGLRSRERATIDGKEHKIFHSNRQMIPKVPRLAQLLHVFSFKMLLN